MLLVRGRAAVSSNIIDLDMHRKVWVTCKETCRSCGHEETCKVHLEADLDRLECPKCHEMTSAVTHIDVDPDGQEYVWQERGPHAATYAMIARRAAKGE